MSRPAPHSPEYEGNKVVSAVDWLGNRFRVGERVAYCISAGRGQMMAIGVVLEIRNTVKLSRQTVAAEADDPDAMQYYDATEYYKVIHRPYDEVTVQVRTLKTSGRWDNAERTKPAWVNAMNITSLQMVETA